MSKFLPKVVSDVDLVFPASVKHLMPPGSYEEGPKPPEEATRMVTEWFMFGLKELIVEAHEGVDETKAMRHLRSILGSFEPKHEQKMWAVATLIHMWFKEYAWEANK